MFFCVFSVIIKPFPVFTFLVKMRVYFEQCFIDNMKLVNIKE
jgi:hypothetical protein